MGRKCNYPVLFEDLKKLRISEFRKWGYLKAGAKKNGVITWYRQGICTGSISVYVDTSTDTPFTEFQYSLNGTFFDTRIYFELQKSNLGRGEIWYFVCPYTGLKCRILYLYNGCFVGRKAIRTGFYEAQVFNKKFRQFNTEYSSYFNLEKYYEAVHSKHFKRTYKGKFTRKFRKLRALIIKGELLEENNPERLL
ncbi:MAG: hypothetical protein ACK5ZX_05685 [Bacteroidota bacterium]